ncbi:hypothetical protein PPL_12110 [Heterostelium album PN500]|uniref:Uncharacterized protein n=1 Tax=Heterostelium pallidum (strain ATCC 26659 / Pp 5 / PN500) TaxID=670386 RepID=D3BLQ7_HETP5|nr:hypothetical protein PPL_12110 [Heterostelium album PN500]EFA77508.1 hypothetical protein PPL_12110 [Heterostelium album PN500]|eukprot:XP_020429636.1 hypothetical protein PPL_12110 [Heterostelium album PN500]
MKQLKPLVDVINKWVKEKKIVGGHTYKVDIVFVSDYKCFTELQGLEEVFNPKVAIDIWSLLRDYSSNVEVGDVKFKLEPPGSKIVGHDEHMMPVFSPKALKDLGGEVNGKLYGQVQPPVFEGDSEIQYPCFLVLVYQDQEKPTTSTPTFSICYSCSNCYTCIKLFFKCFRPDLTPAVLPNSTSSNTTQPMVAKQKRVRTSTHGLPANLQTNLPNVTYNDDCTDTIPHEKQCSSNQVLEIYTSDSNNSTSSFSKNSTNKRKR